MNNTAKSIQAILFATGESASIASLASRLNTDKSSIKEAILELKSALSDHGITLIEQNDEIMLTTSPGESKLIEAIKKEELSKELSKASAETLAIIAYNPGISKSQIEFIRGVNVAYTLRSLMVRGLIENRQEGRSFTYYPTLELLKYYGIDSIEGLPNYIETKTKIDVLMHHQEQS